MGITAAYSARPCYMYSPSQLTTLLLCCTDRCLQKSADHAHQEAVCGSLRRRRAPARCVALVGPRCCNALLHLLPGRCKHPHVLLPGFCHASQSKLLTRCHMQSCSMVVHVVVNGRQQAVKRASSGHLSPLQNMAALSLQTEVKMNADGRGGECHLTCQTCPEFL